MFCAMCGLKLAGTEQFCPSCGTKALQVPSATSATRVGVTSAYVWAIVALPLFFAFIDLIISSRISVSQSFGLPLAIYWLATMLVVYADSRALASAGFKLRAAWGVVLIPVYLFKRSRILKKPQVHFMAWFGSFVLSIGLTFVGSAVLGTTQDGSVVATAIENWLEDGSTVTCPETYLSKVGSQFICTSTSGISFLATVTDADGTVQWEITN